MSNQANQRGGINSALAHLAENKVEAILWFTRLGSVIFTILYIIPLFGVNPLSCYWRALLSNAATSALRLHQRMPQVQLSQIFLATLLLEDSAHYLAYSLIFLFCQPSTLVLFPIFFFALLHSARYLSVLLVKMGLSASQAGQMIANFVDQQQRHILKLVAYIEIFMMPLILLMTFNGKCSLMTPLFYYHFIMARYSSRRNPYTRTVFQELRIVLEGYTRHPSCPQFLRGLILSLVRFFSRLSPIRSPPASSPHN